MSFSINEKEIKSVINLPKEKRYEYFIKKSADLGFVWGLYKEGWALASDEENNHILPLWPAKEYAQLCSKDEWEGYQGEQIDIHDFINIYLDELVINKITPGIFYTPEDRGIIISYDMLKEDLERELERME